MLIDGLSLERAVSAASPEQQRSLAVFAPEPVRDREESPVEHRAIVARQIDEPGLGDETAEFDQLPRPVAPVHDPGSRVIPRLPGFRSPPRRRGPLHRRVGCPQLPG